MVDEFQQKYFSELISKKGHYKKWPLVDKDVHFYGIERFLSSCNLNYGTMLVLGGGMGHEAGFFRVEAGLSVINSDYAYGLLLRGKYLYPEPTMMLFDSRLIPLRDNSVDYCFTRASLHHIPDPHHAIYEMCRVARKGFGFQEGHDTLLMRILCKVGLAEGWEEAGNYIYRFTKREI